MRSGATSASPGRAGTRLAPLRNSRSPLIANFQSVNATLAESRSTRRLVADLAVDDDLDTHVGERLGAERMRPPQARRRDVQRPLDVVHPCRQGVLGFPDDLAVSGGADADRVCRECVEAGVESQVGARFVGIATQHAQLIDAHSAGLMDAHGAPQAARIPVVVDRLGLLQHARDVAPSRGATLGGAVHLHRQHVLIRQSRQLGDVETVGEEVALRVTEVGAVKPGVGLVEDALEGHPTARPRWRWSLLEAATVEHRSVAGGELSVAPPMPGHVEFGPTRVVEVKSCSRAAQLVVSLAGTPAASEIHAVRG